MSTQKRTRRIPKWLKIMLVIGVFAIAPICIGLAMITFWPDVAAQNIDRLRDVIGDDAVAQLEDAVLNVHDGFQQLEYQIGLAHPAAPWTTAQPLSVSQLSTPTALPDQPSPTLSSTLVTATSTPANTSMPQPTFTRTDTITPGPSPTPTLTATYSTASCTIVVSEPVVYANRVVTFTVNLKRDERDYVTTYTWFVNDTFASDHSELAYNFPQAGSFTVKVKVSLKSGQTPICQSSVDVQAASESVLVSTDLPPDPTSTSTPVASSTPIPNTPLATPTISPPQASLPAWTLSPVKPLGKLAGEGQWSPYLQTADGQTTMAYRTFLQPDPLRPYSVPAIVAFDLQTTHLHFVLGTEEPLPLTPQPTRTGAIPPGDLLPGVLIATFNGGFKARHGHFGAMADGIIALPAIDGLATVGIYKDDHVQIGEWGTDIKDSPDLVAWRQNGKMLIHNGQINPQTLHPAGWGSTIKGDTITWRSALGISSDGRTLYYVAGLELDAGILAKTMAQAGAANAFELDVNGFWVHFAAIRANGQNLTADPLFDAMKLKADRYLKSYSRDFFYITAALKK